MQYISLYAFYFIYFIMNGFSAFLPKYFAELGFGESGIGLLTSLPAILSMLFMPLWGTVADRSPQKRFVVLALTVATSLTCVLLNVCRELYPLLAATCLFNAVSSGAMPTATSLSLEYCSKTGKPYGPIRLVGTVGYQAGAVLTAFLFVDSLNGLYLAMGAAVLVAGLNAFLMPDVKGHQFGEKQKLHIWELLRDRHTLYLYIVILFCTMSSQFYMSFFTKYLGDLGMGNDTVSVITLLSVLPEVLFLIVENKLRRIPHMNSVWKWIWLGMAVNAVRWLLLSVLKQPWQIIIVQLFTAVSVMSCLEFFPALWLARHVDKGLSSSAQSMLNVTSFGVAKLLGSLLGGVICEMTGIPFMFRVFGIMLTIGSIAFFIPMKKLDKSDTTDFVS